MGCCDRIVRGVFASRMGENQWLINPSDPYAFTLRLHWRVLVFRAGRLGWQCDAAYAKAINNRQNQREADRDRERRVARLEDSGANQMSSPSNAQTQSVNLSRCAFRCLRSLMPLRRVLEDQCP